MANVFNRERAAMVLVDAHFTSVSRAATKWKISEATVHNYRARLASDLELKQMYLERRQRAENEWHDERLRFLKSALAKLDELVGKATEAKDITAIAHAVKVVGELQVASQVLGGDRRNDSAGAVPAAPAGDTAPGRADDPEPERH